MSENDWAVLEGDCREKLRELPAKSVDCCVTSPPYWALRDYGHPSQIGLETSVLEYVDAVVGVFKEVRRVLKTSGTLWLVLGDCYVSAGGTGNQGARGQRTGRTHTQRNLKRHAKRYGLKPKDLAGVPWRVALGLQAAGWYLRSDIVWHKPNCLPSSARDRPTVAHEYVFLLTRRTKYFYDRDAIAEPCVSNEYDRKKMREKKDRIGGKTLSATHDRYAGQNTSQLGQKRGVGDGVMRNKRTIWTVPTVPYRGDHTAAFPPDLVETCILAGCPEGGLVLDPFCGTGTVGAVALEHRRRFVGIELNSKYAELARARILSTKQPRLL